MNRYVLFIDESGDPSLSSVNEDFPIFVLSGCLFSEQSYDGIRGELDILKCDLFGSAGVILHSRDIRKCEGVFARLFDLDVKQDFYDRLNDSIGRADFVMVAVGIRKHDFIDRYGKLADDPYELSLTFLLERMLMEIDSRGGGIVDVVIESRGKREDATLSKRYDELLWKGSGRIESSRFRARYPHPPLFRKKKENDIGLQVADLCAYPVARFMLNPSEPYPAFDIVKEKLRKGPNGCDGYGLKIFP